MASSLVGSLVGDHLSCFRRSPRDSLSRRNRVETRSERGLPLVLTILSRATRFTPEFVSRWNRSVTADGRSWRVDETYLRLRGKWVICTAPRIGAGKR